MTRIRRSPQQWQDIINRQVASGLSARAYCGSHQLSYAVFCKWRKQLVSSEAAPLIDLSALVRSQHPSSWDIELDLGDGVMLRLRRG